MGVFAIIRMSDNFSLGTELRWLIVVVFICVAVEASSFLNLELFNVLLIQSNAWFMLIMAIAVPINFMLKAFFPLYLSFQYQIKQQKAKPDSSTNVTQDEHKIRLADLKTSDLEKLLSDPQGRNLLLSFLETEFAVENLFFVESCDKFKKDLALLIATSDFSDRKRLEETLNYISKIKTTFILSTAVSSVNLSYRSREKVLSTIDEILESSENLVKLLLKPELFDNAREEIFQLLLKDSCSRFRLTKEFQMFARSNAQDQAMSRIQIEAKIP
jgi:hypothetical protein